MTKIKVDEKGLNARAVNPWTEIVTPGKENNNPIYPLTTPAAPNLVCEGDKIYMFSYDSKEWQPCVIIGDEYVCPTNAETKPFYKIHQPIPHPETLQEAAERVYPRNGGIMENAVNNYKQDCFIAGATHQAPITRSEDIKVIEDELKNEIELYKIAEVHDPQKDFSSYYYEKLTRLLTQIKNLQK